MKKISKKSTQAIFDSRIQELLPLITILRRNEIIAYCKKQNWSVTDRQVDNYIATCKEILQKEFEAFKKEAALNIYCNRLDIYKRAMVSNDLQVARGVQSDLAKMTGVDTANIDITSKGEQMNGFTVTLKDEE